MIELIERTFTFENDEIEDIYMIISRIRARPDFVDMTVTKSTIKVTFKSRTYF